MRRSIPLPVAPLAGLLVAVLIMVGSGCSTTLAGTATAGNGTDRPTRPSATGSGGGTATATPPTSSAAARPKPIDLHAVDMCQLLVKIRPQDFGIDFHGSGLGTDSLVFPGSKECFADG